MVIAYFDCFSGISGDMTLGALMDLGVQSERFIKEIEKLNLKGYSININKIKEHQITATDVNIQLSEKQPHRHLIDIYKIIDESSIDEIVKKQSKEIFNKIAIAESQIHNTSIEKIHFHEVGAVDSIIDIIGACILIKELKIDKIYSSPLPLGSGFVKCMHGIIPIPSPATLELLKEIPVYQTNRKQELVTPTGAAIITSFTQDFVKMPMMKIEKIGYGSGKIKSKYPSLLRIFTGELKK
jgi:uncharacterized protein (TIGR00299 family) protein